MNWLRLFIPSWRFFDQLGTIPQLMYQVLINSEASEWQPVFNKPQRKIHNLFFNPLGNLYLYHQSLVSRLVDESQTAVDLESVKTYQVLNNLVRAKVLKSFNFKIDQQQKTKYQFKVVIVSEQKGNQINLPIDLIISKEMVLK